MSVTRDIQIEEMRVVSLRDFPECDCCGDFCDCCEEDCEDDCEDDCEEENIKD